MSTPLKNPEAEACAAAIAAELPDKAKAMVPFNKFYASHPDLKKWEGLAIGNRAMELFKERAK